MPNKKNNNCPKRINLNNIINKLPIKHHLNESQNALIDFSITWNKWIQNNLTSEIQKLVALNSFKNGVLSVRCTNASAASHLKHLQIGLRDAFNGAGHHQILDIKFDIDKKTTHPKVNNSLSTGSENQHIKKEQRQALSEEALDTLEHCKKGIKNEKLSASLKKLYDTLDSLPKS